MDWEDWAVHWYKIVGFVKLTSGYICFADYFKLLKCDGSFDIGKSGNILSVNSVIDSWIFQKEFQLKLEDGV